MNPREALSGWLPEFVGIAAIRIADAEQIDRILGVALDGLRAEPPLS